MTVRTRFAPSPTGFLHIGSARTALFNYLFAKANNGKYLVRIEDTDKKRSTTEAIDAIISSLKWLDLMPDEDIIFQSKQEEKHIEVANSLLQKGKAYYCFSDQKEIANLRKEAEEKGGYFKFESPWRDADPISYPKDQKPAIRLKTPREGKTIINDLLQGKIIVDNKENDDMILLRSDGTPTYMLACVVDDYDMDITHIIRGDDHLNNATRQKLIYDTMEWKAPEFVHIPLIHGPDGTKLSKRHGALGVEAYKDMGYLPGALNNYLLRLGWAKGNEEIISRAQAIDWFNIEGLGKSPSRIDFAKMKNVNAHYLRNYPNDYLAKMIFQATPKSLSDQDKINIRKAIDSIKPRSELLPDLLALAKIFVVSDKLLISEEALAIIKETSSELIKEIINTLDSVKDFSKKNIQENLKTLAKTKDLKFGELMKYIRPLITGQVNSPSVFEIIEIIGKEESLKRLRKL